MVCRTNRSIVLGLLPSFLFHYPTLFLSDALLQLQNSFLACFDHTQFHYTIPTPTGRHGLNQLLYASWPPFRIVKVGRTLLIVAVWMWLAHWDSPRLRLCGRIAIWVVLRGTRRPSCIICLLLADAIYLGLTCFVC